MVRFVTACVLALVLVSAARADERPGTYLKDGKLAEKLTVLELQGGFAGFTGNYTVVEKDGEWSTGPMLPRDKRGAPSDTGKLDAKQLTDLAAVLAKNDLANLPNAGKPITNPEITTIEWGENFVTLMPEAKDPKVVARYEAIVAAVKMAVK